MKKKSLKYPHMFKMHKFIFLASKNLEKILESSLHLGFSQCMILIFIEKNPKTSQRHISIERDITPAAVSRHIEALVEKGFLSQSENKKNKRENVLEISRKGEDVVGLMIELVNTELDRIFRDVDESEINEMDRLLTKLLSILNEE